MSEKSYTVTQYNRSIERLLKSQVPSVWVKGVITQLNVRGKMCYLTLGEFEEGNPSPKAVLLITLWASELEMYNIRFSRLPMPFELRVELKVSVMLEANFYVPWGKFQPRVVDIDGSFTLGELSQTRRRILEALMRDGLLERNKSLDLSPIPLRVGLITAPDSAAYRDFTTVLSESGYSFDIHFVGAKMQGDSTESTVLKAMKILQRYKLDVICLIRGGGAKTDLVYFDSEKICRAIAECGYPVLTGIGHEIDNSLADLVAFEDLITPTDCAKFLVEKLSGQYTKLQETASAITETWRYECQQAAHDLARMATALRHRWDRRQEMEVGKCLNKAALLSNRSHRQIVDEERRLERNRVGLSRGPAKSLELQRAYFAGKAGTLKYLWKNLKSKSMSRMTETRCRLKEYSRHRTATMTESIDLKQRLIKAADPMRMLQLGFAILRNEDGRIMTRAASAAEGSVFFGELADGVIEGKVISKKENPWREK